jgi:hypothetical protein
LARKTIRLQPGKRVPISPAFDHELEQPGYLFVCFSENPEVALYTSNLRVTGLLRLERRGEEQSAQVGGEDFPVFVPERRPGGQNLAFTLSVPQPLFEAGNVSNGFQRPTSQPNAWVAELGAVAPSLRLDWENPVALSEIHLHFDGDFDHAMETVLMGHPERAVVFCVRRYEILDDRDQVIGRGDDQHFSHAIHRLDKPLRTLSITVRMLETWGAPPALFEIRCYGA